METTFAGRIAEIDRFLDEYNQKLHLDKVKVVDCELDLPRDKLFSMSLDQLDGYRWELAQYVLGLQKELNRQTARMHWAEQNLKRYSEKECSNYDGYLWQERLANVLANDSYAAKLDDFRQKCKLIYDETGFLIGRIEFMAKIAGDIAFAKRKHHFEKEQNG